MTLDPGELFETMCLIRHTESQLLSLFDKGLLRGTVHTAIGQEACAAGTIAVLDKSRDIIFSNHRCHGHYIAYSGDVRGLIAEVMGLESGVCRGIGGSQHLQRDNFYTNGILASGTPISVGMALAEKKKQSGALVVQYLGDGAFGEGVVYESLNLASLWELPVLFVVEDNHYAQSTPSSLQHAGKLETRAESFGIPVTSADGMDAIQVAQSSAALVSKIRKDSSPQLLYLDTYRFSPHSKGDDMRAPEEIENWRKRDPLVLFEERANKSAAKEVLEQTEARVQEIVAELIER